MGESRCAWCGKSLGPRPDLEEGVVSHGICAGCAALLEGETAAELVAGLVDRVAQETRLASEALGHAAGHLDQLAAIVRQWKVS